MSVAVAMHVPPEEMGVLVIAMNSMTPADRAVDFYDIKLRWTKAWGKHGGETYAGAVRGGHIESIEVTEARHESVKAAERGDRALADALWQAADSGDEALARLRSALLGKENPHAE